MWNIKYIKDTVLIQVSYFDYLNILKIKTTNTIKVLDIKGIRKIKWLFNRYKMFCIFFIMSAVIVLILSNVIFKINYIDIDPELEKVLNQELYLNNITTYSFKKSYHKLNQIKASIKAKYNDKIEWLEIEPNGVTYNIKAIKRVIDLKNLNNEPSNIVADKDGILLSIVATSGEVVKNPGDYVKKGDVVVSGIIKNKEEIVEIKKSQANIYAETWYKVTIKHPITFEEKVRAGKNKNFYYIEVLGKKIFYRNNNYELVNEKSVINSKLFKLIRETKSLMITKQIKYREFDLQKMIEEKAYNQINKTLDKDENILLQKTLKNYIENDKMIVEVFFKIKENITKEEKIDLSIKEE